MQMTAQEDPALRRLREEVLSAAADRVSLQLRGGGTKDFYGEPWQACQALSRSNGWRILDLSSLSGISSYEPTELVVTVRCGTPVAELEQVLASRGQFLAFEPPRFGPRATVGGMVAAGLSGPRRAAAGSLRDFVLGAVLMAPSGELLHFGGQVMKNVAGYDVSRLLAGSLGILGPMVEVSLKVLPQPAAEVTLSLTGDAASAVKWFNAWGGQPLPISAAAHLGDSVFLRLSGARAAVNAASLLLARSHAVRAIDPPQAADFWRGLRDQTHPFFASRGDAALWRLSVPSTVDGTAFQALCDRSPDPSQSGATLIEWGGALRWIHSRADAAKVREAAARVGGTATRYRGPDVASGVFHPLASVNAEIHRRIKRELDPARLFNPGRLYPDL